MGITGVFGSGKTTAAKVIKSWGARIIDADKIAHRLIRPGTSVYAKIIKAFGASFIAKDKRINRAKLAKIAFNNKDNLNKLNRIMHAPIIRIIKRQISSYPEGLIIVDAPLLIETGLNKFVDKVIVVKINRQQQTRRIIKKAGLNKADILRRIGTQMPQAAKMRAADFIIDNNRAFRETKKQLGQIRRLLWRN